MIFWAPKEKRSMDAVLRLQALNVALECEGQGEVERNNWGLQVWRFTNSAWRSPGPRRKPLKKTTGPWCAAFVSWCFEEASLRLGYRMWSGRNHLAKKLVTKNFTQIEKPVPGCLFLLHRGAAGAKTGHVGFYVRDLEDGWVEVIDGNIGPFPAKVKRRRYNPSHDPNFMGFWA